MSSMVVDHVSATESSTEGGNTVSLAVAARGENHGPLRAWHIRMHVDIPPSYSSSSSSSSSGHSTVPDSCSGEEAGRGVHVAQKRARMPTRAAVPTRAPMPTRAAAPRQKKARVVVPEEVLSKKKVRGAYSLRVAQLSRAEQTRLAEAARFYLQPLNVKRPSKALQPETWKKRREYYLCFLGFLHNEEGEDVRMADVLDMDKVQAYLVWLKDVRGLDASTRRMHTVGLSCMAFYLLKTCPDDDKALFKKCEEARTGLAQLGAQLGAEKVAMGAPQTKENLRAKGQWLDWQEVLQAVDTLVAQPLPRNAKEAAWLHMKKLALLFYTEIPTGRSKEFWTMTHGVRGATLTGQQRGQWVLHLRPDTHKKNQCTDIPFSPETAPRLVRVLQEYLSVYRPVLLLAGADANEEEEEAAAEEEAHAYVFVHRDGRPFTSSAQWCMFLKKIMGKYGGARVGSSMLRSALVTAVREDSRGGGADVEVRASIAQSMGHSLEMADRVYDRRTAQAKLHKGHVFLARLNATLSGQNQ